MCWLGYSNIGTGQIFLFFAEQCLEMSGNQNPIAVAGLWNIKTWIFYFLISSTFVFTNLQFSPNILRISRTKRVLSKCAWIKSSKTIGMESDPDSKVAPATVTRRGKLPACKPSTVLIVLSLVSLTLSLSSN